MEDCVEQICAPPDLYKYDIRGELPLLLSWDGSEEIPLLLSNGDYILI